MIEVIIISVVWVVSMFLSSVLINKMDILPLSKENTIEINNIGLIPFYLLGPIGLILLVCLYVLRLKNK